MRLSFRQGVVSHAITGPVQAFLSQSVSGGDVTILTSNKPVLASFAHKSTNYLISENNDVVAWLGPFSFGTNYYLYWELDPQTAQRTFGYTTFAPIIQATAPYVNIEIDQHWFDTVNNVMMVWQGAVWVEKIRVFSCLLKDGNTFIPMGDKSAPDFTGTQVGDNSSSLSGRIVFDQTNNPIARTDVQGTFFTTEDPLFANAALVNGIRLESNVSYAKSTTATAMAAYSIVAYDTVGNIHVATYEETGITVLGIITEDVLVNGTAAVVLQGVATNPLWNWSTVGVELWVDNGVLVETDPHLNTAAHPVGNVPVARVLSADSVIFEQGLGGKGERGATGSISNIPPAETILLGGVAISVPATNPDFPIAVETNDPRLTDARTPLPHSHTAAEVSFTPGGGVISNNVQLAIEELGNGKIDAAGDTMTGFLTLNSNPTASLHAASKSYVDALVQGLIWLEPISYVNTISDIINTPPGANELGDLYIVAAGGTGAWLGLDGRIVHWNGTGWTDEGLLSAAPAGMRVGVSMESTSAGSGSFTGQDDNIMQLVNPALGTWAIADIPVLNNAVWVSNATSLHAFHQYAYNGTQWIEFGGTSAISPGLNILVTGTVWNVQDYSVGGTIEAATLRGSIPGDFAPVAHVSDTANPHGTTLVNLSDTDLTTTPPIASDVLTFVGGQWVPQAPSGGGGSSSRINDVQDDTYIETDSAGTGAANTIKARVGAGTHNASQDVLSIDEDLIQLKGLDGLSTAFGGTGGDIQLLGGGGGNSVFSAIPPFVFSKAGGNITVTCGTGGDGDSGGGFNNGGDGGFMQLRGGDGGYTESGGNSGDGGTILIAGGAGSPHADAFSGAADAGNGGNVTINGGDGGDYSGQGGDVNINGGESDSGDFSGNGTNDGGHINITGGLASSSGTGNGGSIRLRAGRANYAGTQDGAIEIRTADSGKASELRFYGDNDTNYVTLKAPNTLAATTSFDLPAADGANGQVLTTNGSGVLSFTTPTVPAPTIPYDMVFQALGVLGISTPLVVGEIIAARAFSVLASNHKAHVVTGPTGSSTVFTLNYDAGGTGAGIVALGTITFTVGGGNNQTVTFSLSAQAVAIGDVLTLELTTPDSNDVFADASFNVLATV